MIRDELDSRECMLSCEVFPPKKEDAFTKVFNVLDSIAECDPAFISVTYGAGGSNAGKHLEISSYIQNKLNIETIAHVTSVGFNRKDLNDELDLLEKEGVFNILALRGDRPQDMTDEKYNSREFEHASDMVKYIRESDRSFCIAGACYPEKHFEAPDKLTDIFHLKQKVDAGCDFLISQLFFDNTFFYRFLELAARNDINVPIHAGIMPITSATQLGHTVSLSGTSVPKKLADIIARYGDDPEDMKKAGIEFAVDQVLDLAKAGVHGIHVYAMNKPELCREIFTAVRENF